MRRLALLTIFLCACSSSTLQPRPDIVIHNVTIIDPVNEQILPEHEIIITNGRITGVRPQGAPTRATHEIDATGLLALPGFVNTHTHLWQHLAKGFRPAAKLQEWVGIYRYAHYLTPEETYDLTRAAAHQALLSGITTVADFASVNFRTGLLDATVRALRDAHVDGAVVWWHPAAFLPPAEREQAIRDLQRIAPSRVSVLMGFGPLSFYPLPAVADGITTAEQLGLRMTEHTMENVQEARDLHDRLTAYHDEHGSALAPADHAVIQTVLAMRRPGNETRERIAQAAHHALGTTQETPLTTSERDALTDALLPPMTSPIPLLEHLGALDGFLAIHAVWPNPEDVARLARAKAAVSYNPESNMYLSSGTFPWHAYETAGVTITIGTDGAASNDSIDALSALKTAVNLQKIGTLNPAQPITPWAVLRAATINGAKALGLPTGALRTGHEADIVLLDTTRLGMAPFVPSIQGASLVVNSASPRDVHTVISNGRVVVRKGELTTIDEPQLAKRVTQIAHAVIERQEQGRDWHEQYDLTGAWSTYASTRTKDHIDLTITNTSTHDMNVTVAFSGTTFGGSAAPVLRPDTIARFPLDTPSGYWSTEHTLSPGEGIRIQKPRGSRDRTVTTGNNATTKTGPAAEQIAVIATPN